MKNNFFLDFIKIELQKDYFKKIREIVNKDSQNVLPPKKDIFNAFLYTPFEKVKIVILWQDPYPWENQAHWLSFSVKDWVEIPKSLKNIFIELKDDLWYEIPKSWNLTKWAKWWVLLLNTILTVKKWHPLSHANIWWEIFTDKIIKEISQKKENIVFILWGKHAQSKIPLIDTKKHFIIKSAHPSPLSANRWFFKSKPFSKTNSYLISKNISPINWDLN